MADESDFTSERKKDHLRLCLTDDVSFKEKSTGFGLYDFVHDAVTEVDISKINLETTLFGRKITYPFLISCMTGGTAEAGNINLLLAEAAEELRIAIGVGSQRQALENSAFHSTYKIIREKAPSVPVFGNIGAAQVLGSEAGKILSLRDQIDADAMVVHFNPLQELIQRKGESVFTGVLKKLELLVKKLDVPVIAKEVGAGISVEAAVKLLDCGVAGIDTAGAGGTSWSGVEILRNQDEKDYYLWDWGLPTAYCIRELSKLKKNYNFLLIGSGGINSGTDMSMAFALGADIAASARKILIRLNANGPGGVVELIQDWFDQLKKIMYLTGSGDLTQLRKNKIIKKEEML